MARRPCSVDGPAGGAGHKVHTLAHAGPANWPRSFIRGVDERTSRRCPSLSALVGFAPPRIAGGKGAYSHTRGQVTDRFEEPMPGSAALDQRRLRYRVPKSELVVPSRVRMR
jgi:hypothetical protein